MAMVMSNQDSRPSSQSSSIKIRRKSSWATTLHPRAALKASRPHPVSSSDIELASLGGAEFGENMEEFMELGLTLNVEGEKTFKRTVECPELSSDHESHDTDDLKSPRAAKPFQKWMMTLQRRGQHRSGFRSSIDDLKSLSETVDDRDMHDFYRRSSSDSSFAFVTGVRSASISIAGSVLTRSRRDTARSSHYARTDRSSRGSISAGRRSEDSVRSERSVIDPAVKERLLQRRRILEELISTEEGYIGDVKFLMNVYVTTLNSLPTQHPGLRSSINRNLSDIVELHEEILYELRRAVPNSELTQLYEQPTTTTPAAKAAHHHRWRSLDSVPEDEGGLGWLQDVPGLMADPDVAAAVSKIFRERMHRFFVYEEYGAKYEMMIKDVAATARTLPQWEMYQKGLEALAASLGSINQQLDQSKKSLTIGDLLVKPIQRICKYPLLFAELLKYTPVCDCPSSHAEIETTLARLREATSEINRATDDPLAKKTMETTWLLQDRLVFPNQYFDAALKTTIRSLGQIQLCGALHVCWQTRGGVNGQYMVCLLYKECVCLATASKNDQLYTIYACIGLNTVKVEEADNGRGLQCHTAPFSWKLVFEINHQLYEVIMTACTPKEEHEWRNRLQRLIPSETQDFGEPLCCSSLSMNIKSLGTVFGKPGSVARRLSIHRATTVGPKSPLCQVIVKNTMTIKESTSTAPDSPLNRSQSLLTTNSRIPILAPPRGDRARLEAQLSDVWSRHILPFPGITNRSRSEQLVRTSASTMMRKLSVASITNSFAKRSASSASVNTMKASNEEPPCPNDVVESSTTHNCDVSSSVLDPDQDYLEMHRLPVIRDAIERTSSYSSRFPSAETSAFSGTVRKMDLSKPDPAPERTEPLDTSEKLPLNAQVLQASSVNSAPQLSLGRASSAPVSLMEKENVSHAHKIKRSVHETSSPTKPSKRSKVGGRNRNLVTGAIRSFFR